MSHSAANLAINWTEQGLVPDRVIRASIRRLLRQRLGEIRAGDTEASAAATERFIADIGEAPVALAPELANEQHYEVPALFYAHVLGPHRKYSSCYWGDGIATLGEAEEAALRLTCEWAQLAPGQDILELGCGWGSLALWMAQHFHGSRITAISNSHSQRAYIEAEPRRPERQ